MIGFGLGLLYANAGEWLVHKYVLHGLGKQKTSFWRFHWHEHHRTVRRTGGLDEAYLNPLFRDMNAKTKEALGLIVAAIAHAPLFAVAPWFTAGVWYSGARYYYVHRKSHLDPEWARATVPWHVDHHLGPDQDKNWCVTRPWFDWVMGTRVPYVGTPREAQDRARAAQRAGVPPTSSAASPLGVQTSAAV
ncbi:MAG: sterol desaturase family protein [Deltaproteobacteria bacterium]|nr:sterol desaturase family protein [Deltaproteobacteria bacterium]